MKLTDELKSKLENAKSEEEAKTILTDAKKGAEEAGFEISDEELDNAAGGNDRPRWGYNGNGIPY